MQHVCEHSCVSCACILGYPVCPLIHLMLFWHLLKCSAAASQTHGSQQDLFALWWQKSWALRAPALQPQLSLALCSEQ